MKPTLEANNNINNLYRGLLSNMVNSKAFHKWVSPWSCSTACTKRWTIYQERLLYIASFRDKYVLSSPPLCKSSSAVGPWYVWIIACALGEHPFSQVWRQDWPRNVTAAGISGALNLWELCSWRETGNGNGTIYWNVNWEECQWNPWMCYYLRQDWN